MTVPSGVIRARSCGRAWLKPGKLLVCAIAGYQSRRSRNDLVLSSHSATRQQHQKHINAFPQLQLTRARGQVPDALVFPLSTMTPRLGLVLAARLVRSTHYTLHSMALGPLDIWSG